MDDNQITPDFIESMVDRIIEQLSDKLEQLDISLDYLAAGLLDSDAFTIGATQKTRGRGAPKSSREE
jgi:hypothetical protein